VQAHISLEIDQQPGSLFRVVRALRRFGFALDTEDLNANPVDRGYSVDLTVDGAALSRGDLAGELQSLRGVTRVVRIEDAHRSAAHDRRRALVESRSERARRSQSAARIDRLIRSYPTINAELVGYIESVAHLADSTSLIRSFGVRCGRRMAVNERRFDHALGIEDALDKVMVGFLFPIARVRIEGSSLNLRDSIFLTDAFDGSAAPMSQKCIFLEGLIEGMLNHAPGLPQTSVEHTACVGNGHIECCFRVDEAS